MIDARKMRVCANAAFLVAVLKQYLQITVCVIATVSITFLPLRLYARWRSFKRIFWDDFFVIIASVLLLTMTTLSFIFAETMDKLNEIGSGRLWPPPPNFPKLATQSGRTSLAGMLIFTTSLWTVKVSFLLFFRRLRVIEIRNLRLQWWIVTIFTMLCYLANFPHIEYICFVGTFEELMVHKCDKLLFTMRFNCGLDVVTDVASR